MRQKRVLVTRVVVLALGLAALAVFGVMALAQGEVEHPEGVGEGHEGGNSWAHGSDVTLPADAQAPEGEAILYKNIAGQSFHPRESTTAVQYGGGGCLYRTSNSGFVVGDVQLPDGAEIEAIRVFYNDDNDDNELDFYLYRFDGLGGFEQVAAASSEGAPGRTWLDIEPLDHVVDNAAESLGMVVGMDAATSSSVQLCGVRIQYRVDVPSLTLLPAVYKEIVGGGR